VAKRNKSALKANRQNIKRRDHNRALRAKLRTGLKSIRKSLDGKDIEAAKTALRDAGVTHGDVVDLTDAGIAILSFQDPDDINLELTAPLS